MAIFAIFFQFASVFVPWTQALMAGVHLSVLDILAMRMRKTDVKVVVQVLIMAHHAGFPLSSAEVEKAYLQGVDLEKVVLAYVRAKKDGMQITFQELVDADLEGRR